jgi:hypothetical protein
MDGMKAFSEIAVGRYKWVETGPRAFELRAGREVVASLEWPHVSGVRAQGRAGESAWDLRRLSLFGPYIRVGTLEEDTEVAHFGKSSLDEACTVVFHSGQVYYWRPLAMVDGMSFETPDGKPVVDFRPHVRAEQHSANITILKEVEPLPVLLLLGWYILEMEYREDVSLSSGEASAQH